MGGEMERMFNKQEFGRQDKTSRNAPQRGGGNAQPRFASLTAGLMARKGEAVPAPAHLDGVSIHSHGVARQPQSIAEQELSQTTAAPLFENAAPEPAPKPAPVERPQAPYGTRHVPRVPQGTVEPAPQPEPEPTPRFEPEAHEATAAPRPLADEPVPPPVEILQRRAERLATVGTGDCCALPLPAAVTETLPAGPYAKVTTRLDRERVRKLKILAARMETTNQKVLLAALDHYLDYACDVLASECPCLARSLREDS